MSNDSVQELAPKTTLPTEVKQEIPTTESIDTFSSDTISEQPQPSIEPTSYSPETYTPDSPAAKFITPNSETEVTTDTLGAELEVLDMFDQVAQNKEQNQNLNEKLNMLEAEEEILEELEKLPVSTFNIEKNNRPRIHKNKQGYEIIGNEPDPLEEPELPIPEDMLVEDEQEVELGEPTAAEDVKVTESLTEISQEPFAPEPTTVLPTLEKEPETEELKAETIKENTGPMEANQNQYDILKSNEYDWQEKTFVQKNKVRAEAEAKGEFPPTEDESQSGEEDVELPKNTASKFFTNYLKSSLEETKPKKPAKKKRKSKANKKLGILILAITIFVLTFIGIGIYVNQYALNPQVSLEKAKQTTQIPFKDPAYIPAGYKINAQTVGNTNKVELVYSFINDDTRTLNIKIIKADIDQDQLFADYVKPSGLTFLNYNANETSYWYVSDNTLIFKDANYVYELTSSVKMAKEELQRIGEGVQIDQNISS